MGNAIFRGQVRHRRFHPKSYTFHYTTEMFFLDVSSIEQSCKEIPFLSYNRFNLLAFNEKNYLPKHSGDLLQRIQAEITAHGYSDTIKEAYILTNLSYFGFCYNPVSFYYVYNDQQELTYILAEVNNTPWNERYTYVLPCEKNQAKHTFDTDKVFHISPFMPMKMRYKWYTNIPNTRINFHIQTFIDSKSIFDATLTLKRVTLNSKNIATSLLLRPFISQKVKFSIYWQALKMWLRRFPVFEHPGNANAS